MVPQKSRIKLVGVNYDCNFEVLPDFQLFPNAEYVHIGTKMKDYSRLRNLQSVRQLYLSRYSDTEFSAFKHLELDRLGALRGRFETYDLPTKYAKLQECRHLVRFGRVAIRRLELDCCQRVDHSTLSNIRGLEGLLIRSRRTLQSFDFVAGLKKLKMLVTVATPLTKTDISYLCDSGVPTMAFFGASRKLIHQIADANRRVTVTNGDILMQNGKEYTGCAMYERGLDEATRFGV